MLAVSPKARKQGIAYALIRECIQRAKNRGKRGIGLQTADFMERAMGLYKSIGFERIPEFDFEHANDGIIVKAFRYKI